MRPAILKDQFFLTEGWMVSYDRSETVWMRDLYFKYREIRISMCISRFHTTSLQVCGIWDKHRNSNTSRTEWEDLASSHHYASQLRNASNFLCSSHILLGFMIWLYSISSVLMLQYTLCTSIDRCFVTSRLCCIDANFWESQRVAKCMNAEIWLTTYNVQGKFVCIFPNFWLNMSNFMNYKNFVAA